MAVVFNDLHSSMPTSAQAIRLSIDMERIYSTYDEGNLDEEMERFFHTYVKKAHGVRYVHVFQRSASEAQRAQRVQRGSERLLPSLDIATQANATPEQQCTRCPYHERALVEREVGRLLAARLRRGT